MRLFHSLKSGDHASSLDDRFRIYGSDHHISDDSRTHRRQFCHLCGYPHCGNPGAVAATAGCVFPSCIIIFILANLYLKYRNGSLLNGALTTLRPAVVAMIASAGLSILLTAFFQNGQKITLNSIQWEMVLIFILCFILLRKTKVSPVAVMLLAGVMKVLFSL